MARASPSVQVWFRGGVAGTIRKKELGPAWDSSRIRETRGAPAVPAMWSRYDGSGDGVRTKGVERMVDPFLDVRARREHGNQAYLDTQQAVLDRVEAGIGEPGENDPARWRSPLLSDPPLWFIPAGFTGRGINFSCRSPP